MTSHPLAENTALIVCHGTHSVYDIIYIIYDVTHTVCISTQALYLTWNPLKLPSHPLCLTSQPPCQRHHTYCVIYHRWHMYAIICIIYDIISTLYDNSPLYLWHHMHYIHYITQHYISHLIYSVWYHLHCVTSHNDSIYDIKHCKVLIYSLYMASHTVLWPHNSCVLSQPLCLTLHSVYFWHYTQCTNFMKRRECMSSQPLMYDTICTTYEITSTLYDITKLYLWCQVHNNIKSTLSDLSSTVSV